ncbi:hypothetical protein EH223_00785 [candidate division KSB1 bacterium]|nr:hypothetical protein [candidate division KSB1 bacterium]RQW07187.1 MAG: hypothetical protein EH223_00785 [candidate division KSB1 bacterium]
MNKESKEIDLFPLFITVLAARWLVVRNVVLTVVLVALISFVLPKKYIATATLMPPSDDNKMAMGFLSDVSVPGLSLPAAASSADILHEMLKSRSVGERVLNRYFCIGSDSLPLYKILKMPSAEIGLLQMRKKVRFVLSKQKILSIIVELGDAKLAADVANAYIEELDQVNQEKSVSQAKNSRVYLESQLQKTHAQLFEATKKLATFQQQNKAVSLENQMAASIQQAGELQGQILNKKIEIGVLQQSMKPGNPVIVRAQQELQEMERRYAEFQYGSAEDGDNSALFLVFNDVPEVAVDLAELMREVKVQETLWQLLNQQYYQTKIEEARNTPTVQILDAATPPPFASSPNKKGLVVVFGMLSFMLTVFWVLAIAYWKRLKTDPAKQSRLQIVSDELEKEKSILNRITKR